MEILTPWSPVPLRHSIRPDEFGRQANRHWNGKEQQSSGIKRPLPSSFKGRPIVPAARHLLFFFSFFASFFSLGVLVGFFLFSFLASFVFIDAWGWMHSTGITLFMTSDRGVCKPAKNSTLTGRVPRISVSGRFLQQMTGRSEGGVKSLVDLDTCECVRARTPTKPIRPAHCARAP